MLDRSAVIAGMRRFNRFYTRQIGLLAETLTQSRFTLTEARVLFELGHRAALAADAGAGMRHFLTSSLQLDIGPAASEIAADLRVDPAYLTRILRKFGDLGLTESRQDPGDGRRRILSLTEKGRRTLGELQAKADEDIGQMISRLDDAQAAELGSAFGKVERLLGSHAAPDDIRLRPHRIGDVGWVIERQSRLYAEEYEWNEEYEALVCEIGGRFLRDFVPGKEFCWIAERGDERLGAVFLVRRTDEEAQLRMLHVEASARGQGVGSRLVAECIETARRVGYRRMLLWTNDVLTSARHIYERAGFTLVEQEGHHSFGHDLHGQTWALELSKP